ncbi:unnamed protein product [Vitrella brassicaformis CCMP3155]|uniref:Uncharacterized protein n=1 Tax=Vitrella brassicaformis (strain CCMP3155) TaxID=1169540 RepID=A0A0G4ER65_VITBC|nr:unnamed protein product [Vitrella brassicaformis CCMP3155]|eukprot:CEL99942.1 unnamed protein product [Vitrella brassicaformis CCMP3155]
MDTIGFAFEVTGLQHTQWAAAATDTALQTALSAGRAVVDSVVASSQWAEIVRPTDPIDPGKNMLTYLQRIAESVNTEQQAARDAAAPHAPTRPDRPALLPTAVIFIRSVMGADIRRRDFSRPSTEEQFALRQLRTATEATCGAGGERVGLKMATHDAFGSANLPVVWAGAVGFEELTEACMSMFAILLGGLSKFQRRAITSVANCWEDALQDAFEGSAAADSGLLALPDTPSKSGAAVFTGVSSSSSSAAPPPISPLPPSSLGLPGWMSPDTSRPSSSGVPQPRLSGSAGSASHRPLSFEEDVQRATNVAGILVRLLRLVAAAMPGQGRSFDGLAVCKKRSAGGRPVDTIGFDFRDDAGVTFWARSLSDASVCRALQDACLSRGLVIDIALRQPEIDSGWIDGDSVCHDVTAEAPDEAAPDVVVFTAQRTDVDGTLVAIVPAHYRSRPQVWRDGGAAEQAVATARRLVDTCHEQQGGEEKPLVVVQEDPAGLTAAQSSIKVGFAAHMPSVGVLMSKDAVKRTWAASLEASDVKVALVTLTSAGTGAESASASTSSSSSAAPPPISPLLPSAHDGTMGKKNNTKTTIHASSNQPLETRAAEGVGRLADGGITAGRRGSGRQGHSAGKWVSSEAMDEETARSPTSAHSPLVDTMASSSSSAAPFLAPVADASPSNAAGASTNLRLPKGSNRASENGVNASHLEQVERLLGPQGLSLASYDIKCETPEATSASASRELLCRTMCRSLTGDEVLRLCREEGADATTTLETKGRSQ